MTKDENSFESIENQFFSGHRSRESPFCLNDSVRICRGPEAGSLGAVVALHSVNKKGIGYVIELGESGDDVIVYGCDLERLDKED